MYNAIDLFCGCGGFSLGFEKAGFNVLYGIDCWKDALITFEKNHNGAKGILADLSKTKPEDFQKEYKLPKIDVIIGGPPCQGFSVAGKRIVDDERNKLYKAFVRFVSYYKPQAFVLENVPNLLSIGNGIVRDSVIKDFADLGYNVQYKVLLASDYGVPQNRRRAVFVGLMNGEFAFNLATVSTKTTCFQALSDLPEESQEDGSEYKKAPQSEYQKAMREQSKCVYNHQTSVHNDKTVHIISLVPDGGNYKDLPIELQDTRKVHIAWTRINSNRPSITIDTGHRHHFHYKYNRIPTARESARLQSFPDTFIFYGSRSSQYKQIGNAVPPLMGAEIARTLKKYLI